MRVRHLEELEPICPACRGAKVHLARVLRGDPRDVLEGLLACGACGLAFPIVDGIPVLVRDPARLVREQVLGIMGRDDLSETVLSLLGEASGASSAVDALRQMTSTYVQGHYADRDPADGRVPSLVGLVARALGASGGASGATLDLGCSVGRSTFELASRTGGRDGRAVLGIDLNFAKLRIAQSLLRRGRVAWPKRQVGLVYEEHVLTATFAESARVDFWCADATALPFAAGTFGLATSLNVLDCVASPRDHLRAIEAVLAPRGVAVVASSFDWNPAATPPDEWLAPGEVAMGGLARIAHEERIPWTLPLHARSDAAFAVDLFAFANSSG